MNSSKSSKSLISKCLLCGQSVRPHECLCTSCASRLDYDLIASYMEFCPFCGYPVISNDYICPHCKGKGNVLHVHSLCDYKSWFSRNVLEAFKFGHRRELSRVMALIMSKTVSECFDSFLLVPVPCSPSGLKKRGFDQMKETVRHISKAKTFDIIINTGRSLEQKRLGKKERKLLSQGKYRIRPDITPSMLDMLRSHPVLLLDDIMTTGSTLDACASVLLDAGCPHIEALTWFVEL